MHLLGFAMFPQQLHAPYSFLPLPDHTQTLSNSAGDPNSPELFRQNLHLVHSQALRVQALARNVISGMRTAYQMGASPAHTHADMLALRQDLHELLGLLRQTGVGSLPLNDNPSAEAIERDTELTYERLTRSHGSAGTVLHLLTSSGSSSIGK